MDVPDLDWSTATRISCIQGELGGIHITLSWWLEGMDGGGTFDKRR